MQIFLFIALLISVVAVIFAVQNTEPVTVSFVVWKTQGSLALVLLIALAAGALISFFVSLPSNLRTRWTIRQQRKKMTELETSLADLRAQLEQTQSKLDELTQPAGPAVSPLAEPTAEPDKTALDQPEIVEPRTFGPE